MWKLQYDRLDSSPFHRSVHTCNASMSLFACLLCITCLIPGNLRCKIWLLFARICFCFVRLSECIGQPAAVSGSVSLKSLLVYDLNYATCYSGFNTTLLVSFLTQRPKSILDFEACSTAWVKSPTTFPPEYPSEWRATPPPR